MSEEKARFLAVVGRASGDDDEVSSVLIDMFPPPLPPSPYENVYTSFEIPYTDGECF
jgi:hypothetical protein